MFAVQYRLVGDKRFSLSVDYDLSDAFLFGFLFADGGLCDEPSSIVLPSSLFYVLRLVS